MGNAPRGMSAAMATEQANPESAHLDRMSAYDIVRLLNRNDRTVADAVAAVLPDIARAVERIVPGLRAGGRLIYVGAGTSGRLGVVDASECPPTFGVPPTMVQGIIAGGRSAMFVAKEGAEDHAGAGAREISRRKVGPNDTVCGLSCSGRTPFVYGALERARERGACTIAVYCNPGGIIGDQADVSIVPVTGPEVIAGSTRMKAGTAEKMVLNMLSTATMVRLGRVTGNVMAHMTISCEKLRYRAIQTIMKQLDVSEAEAARRIDDADNNLAAALRP